MGTLQAYGGVSSTHELAHPSINQSRMTIDCGAVWRMDRNGWGGRGMDGAAAMDGLFDSCASIPAGHGGILSAAPDSLTSKCGLRPTFAWAANAHIHLSSVAVGTPPPERGDGAVAGAGHPRPSPRRLRRRLRGQP